MDWLYWRTDAPPPPFENEAEPVPIPVRMTTEEKLELELEKEREKRRMISAENCQLHCDKAELLKEIGELRVKIARLEEGKNRLAVANGISSENSSAT